MKLKPELKVFLRGRGQIEEIDQITQLILPAATRSEYSDAQLDDYAGRPRRSFPHHPPLKLSVRVRFQGDRILGTAGFGFWNQPFMPGGGWPSLPRAIWFFYASPPSDMALALDVPGHGWKAATIDATQLSAPMLAPLAPIVLLLNRSKRLYRRLWPRVQRALTIAEQSVPINSMRDWHTYAIDWEKDRARFYLDDQIVLHTDRSPRGPLGLVIWIDNQFAVVTPTGRIKFGLLDVEQPQGLEIADLQVE
jgi:hypothetical protein